MNTMNMAGFTAEASLYKSGRHYRVNGTPNDLAGSRVVLPQLPRQIELLECLGGCAIAEDVDSCKTECFWNDFLREAAERDDGGDGGDGGGGRPIACLRQCNLNCSRTPRAERAACLADCIESC